MKKKETKEKKKLWIEALYFLSLFIMVLFGAKILLVLITTPILIQYAAAFDWYQITGNADYFKKASDFVNSWFITLISFTGGIVLYKLIKNKRDKE